MATKTLAQIRSRVRFIGGFENSTKFTDALLNDEINVAYAALWELLDDSGGGYLDTTGAVATVAAQDWVALPVDFWRLKGVDILIGGRYYALRQVGIEERNDFQASTGRPAAYRTTAGSTRGRLTLYPTPSGVESLRVVYAPTFTPLASDSDTVEGFNEWHDFITYSTLLVLDDREQNDIGPRAARVDQIKQRIRAGMARRRSAGPEYLTAKDDTTIDDLALLRWSP